MKSREFCRVYDKLWGARIIESCPHTVKHEFKNNN